MPVVPSQEIIEAINSAYITQNMTQGAWAKFIGVPAPRISDWRRGTDIADALWKKLYPHIKEYLPADFSPRYSSESRHLRVVRRSDLKSSDLKDLVIDVNKLATGRQVVTGVINVGVPINKIVSAIQRTNLTDKQKNELLFEILGE